MGEVGDYWREHKDYKRNGAPGQYACPGCKCWVWKRKKECSFCHAPNPNPAPKKKVRKQ